MTADITKLSREALIDLLVNETTHANKLEAARRLRADGERIAWLEQQDARAEKALSQLRLSAPTHSFLCTLCQDQGELATWQRVDVLVAAYKSIESQLAAANGKVVKLQQRFEDLMDVAAKQLAANGKGERIKNGERVRYQSCEGHSGVGVVIQVDSYPDVSYPYRVRFEGSDKSEWMNDDEIVERLPPEPAVRKPPFIWTAEDAAKLVSGASVVCHGVDYSMRRAVVRHKHGYGRPWFEDEYTTDLEMCDPLTLITPEPAKAVEPAQDGKERRYGSIEHGPMTLVEIMRALVPGSPAMHACERLASMIDGVAEVAANCEVVARAREVPEAVRQEMAHVAAKLRRL